MAWVWASRRFFFPSFSQALHLLPFFLLKVWPVPFQS